MTYEIYVGWALPTTSGFWWAVPTLPGLKIFHE